MTTETRQGVRPGQMLAKVLRADAIVILSSSIILLLGSRPVASLIGLGNPNALLILGFILLTYGITLLAFAGRDPWNRRIAWLAIILNGLWVLGSYLGLLLGWFPVNTAGRWAIALVAEVVALFAILEFIALRRANRSD